jgi:hypothetical protein
MSGTPSRCWISGLSPSSSTASLDRSPGDIYTSYVCNPSKVLHLLYLSSSTCSTTWPWGRLRLSSPTMFVRERSHALRLQRYEHHHCSATLQLHRIDHGKKVCRKIFVFCFKPQQWYQSRPMHSCVFTVRTHRGCGCWFSYCYPLFAYVHICSIVGLQASRGQPYTYSYEKLVPWLTYGFCNEGPFAGVKETISV